MERFPVKKLWRELQKVRVKGWWLKRIPVGALVAAMMRRRLHRERLVRGESGRVVAPAGWKKPRCGVETLLDAVLMLMWFKSADLVNSAGMWARRGELMREVVKTMVSESVLVNVCRGEDGWSWEAIDLASETAAAEKTGLVSREDAELSAEEWLRKRLG